MAPGMHARNNDDAFVVESIEKRVWETRKEGATRVAVNNRERFRSFGNGNFSRGDDIQELMPQTGALLFIPPKRRLNIRSGGWAKDDRLHEERFLMRRSTSFQGIPSTSPPSSSSSRRSSSAR
jgi:hypothetical protein